MAARNAGLGSQVPSRTLDRASSRWTALAWRPIAEAIAAPDTAMAAWTVTSRRRAG
jgi:hypothetical protein